MGKLLCLWGEKRPWLANIWRSPQWETNVICLLTIVTILECSLNLIKIKIDWIVIFVSFPTEISESSTVTEAEGDIFTINFNMGWISLTILNTSTLCKDGCSSCALTFILAAVPNSREEWKNALYEEKKYLIKHPIWWKHQRHNCNHVFH